MRLQAITIGTKVFVVGAALSGAALAVSASSVIAAAPAKPSFDCTKAASPVEKAICASAPLAQADSELADVYQERRRALSAAAAARLAVDEKRFLAARERVFGFGAKDPAALLLGEIAGRVTFLRNLRIPPEDGLAGTWSNVSGTVTVAPNADGGVSVRVDANEPVTARWVCATNGKGRIVDGVLKVQVATDGAALKLSRDGETLKLDALPGDDEADWTPDYCGLNGSVDGIYFAVQPPKAASR